MRKINVHDSENKKEKRLKIFFGLFLIFIMIFSTAGFALLSSNPSNPIEEEEQNYDGKYWNYNSDGTNFYFSNPLESIDESSINIDKTLNDYLGKELFLDIKNEAFLEELTLNIGRYPSRIQPVCLGECEKDLPEKTCEDNLIVWKESKNNLVYQLDNCIFIEGDLVSIDSFLYKILGFI